MDLGAEQCLAQRQRQVHGQVGVVAREHRMSGHAHGDIDVAATFGLARQADLLSVPNARGDLDLQSPAADLKVPLGAPLDLLEADGGVGGGVRWPSRLLPTPARGSSGEAGRGVAGTSVTPEPAEERIEVGMASTTGSATTACPAACTAAEEGAEEVAEARDVLGVTPILEAHPAGEAASGSTGSSSEPGEGVASTAGRAGLLIRLPVRTELVIGLALLGVREDLVGLADLLEALLGAGVPGVDVGMVLAGKTTEGLLDVGLIGALLYAKRGVVIAILHPSPSVAKPPRVAAPAGRRASWHPSPHSCGGTRPGPSAWSGKASADEACGVGPRPAHGPCRRRGPA